MVQDPHKMMFCVHCKMNVFPSRRKFNIRIFVIFAILMLIFLMLITVLVYTFFSQIILLIFFMWGFMIFNPYIIFYGLQKKQHCPYCFNITREKNLDYIPFGSKEPEIYKNLTPSDKPLFNWFCPYCGIALNQGIKYCKSCGKELKFMSK
ncbi:MAG: hypothetical protein ACFFEY_16420 [Candidatus Thorarchaeota archaeon]